MSNLIENMKSAMFTTMNTEEVGDTKYFKGKDKTVHRMLLNTHSPCNAVSFKVRAWVTDRCHTHLRTHSVMNNTYFCGSSRKDLDHGKEHSDGETLYRLIEFHVDLKRFIEISGRRLCPSAHKDVRNFWTMLCKEAFKLVPELETHAVPPCVHRGFCVEGMTNCGYEISPDFFRKRMMQQELAEALKKDGGYVTWEEWKNKYC